MWVLPKTTNIPFTYITILDIQKVFFLVPKKVLFNLNFLSRFSEGPKSNRTKPEIQKFVVLPKRNLRC